MFLGELSGVPGAPPAWEIKPELGGEHDLLAPAADGLADE
jgi:hypothetical protein